MRRGPCRLGGPRGGSLNTLLHLPCHGPYEPGSPNPASPCDGALPARTGLLCPGQGRARGRPRHLREASALAVASARLPTDSRRGRGSRRASEQERGTRRCQRSNNRAAETTGPVCTPPTESNPSRSGLGPASGLRPAPSPRKPARGGRGWTVCDPRTPRGFQRRSLEPLGAAACGGRPPAPTGPRRPVSHEESGDADKLTDVGRKGPR